jgi:hypothetical protein
MAWMTADAHSQRCLKARRRASPLARTKSDRIIRPALARNPALVLVSEGATGVEEFRTGAALLLWTTLSGSGRVVAACEANGAATDSASAIKNIPAACHFLQPCQTFAESADISASVSVAAQFGKSATPHTQDYSLCKPAARMPNRRFPLMINRTAPDFTVSDFSVPWWATRKNIDARDFFVRNQLEL